MKNGVEKSNQKSLESIEKLNFVSFLDTGNLRKIGEVTIPIGSSDESEICSLGNDIYMVVSGRNLQAFRYKDKEFTLGEAVDTGYNSVFESKLTGIAQDPEDLGCFFFRGKGNDYGLTVATYAKVDETDLSIQFAVKNPTTQGRTYKAQSHFMHNDLIVGNTGDRINGIFRIDRENMVLTEVIGMNMEKYYSSVKLSEDTILSYYSGGNAKSWYLKMVRVDTDGKITEGPATLVSTTISGISKGQTIFKFANGDVYVPITNGNLFKVSYDLETLDITAATVPYSLPKYDYSGGNIIFDVDNDLYHLSSDIEYITSNSYKTSIFITRVKAVSGGLNIRGNGPFTPETRIKSSYYPTQTSEAGAPKCFMCVDKDIYECVLVPGYVEAEPGGACDGISLNTASRYANNLKVLKA